MGAALSHQGGCPVRARRRGRLAAQLLNAQAQIAVCPSRNFLHRRWCFGPIQLACVLIATTGVCCWRRRRGRTLTPLRPVAIADVDGPVADWGHLLVEILDNVKKMLGDDEDSHVAMVRATRLVNRHWGWWATEAATFLNVTGPVPLRIVAYSVATKFKRVRKLSFWECRGHFQGGLEALLVLRDLNQLDLRGCELADEDARPLGEVTTLTHLDISGKKTHQTRITDQSLERLGQLRSLRHLNLHRCTRISSGGLSLLGTLTCLEYLDITNCGFDANSAMVHVGRLAALTRLTIARISDLGLARTSALTRLQSLVLQQPRYITEIGMQTLGKLNSLTRLYMGSSRRFAAASLGQLAGLVGLQRLNLRKCFTVQDSDLVHLGHLTSVTDLCLQCADGVSEESLKHILKLRRLKSLYLRQKLSGSSASLMNAVEGHLTNLKALTQLVLCGALGVTDAALAQMGSLTLLKRLCLGGNAICGGLHHLHRLALTHLGLRRCTFSSPVREAIRPVTRLANLEYLDVGHCKVTDDCMQAVGSLSSLTFLSLKDLRRSETEFISDTGLGHLLKLTALEHLDIRNNRMITDVGLGYVGQLSSLTALNLGQLDKITDGGLVQVGWLKRLKHLNVQGCPAVVRDGLGHLKRPFHCTGHNWEDRFHMDLWDD